MGILCYDLVEECKPFMVLENIVVSREVRGQGIGAKLMREIEKVAKVNEVKYTMLASTSSREEAHKFYEEVGYKENMVQGFKKFL